MIVVYMLLPILKYCIEVHDSSSSESVGREAELARLVDEVRRKTSWNYRHSRIGTSNGSSQNTDS